MNSWPDVQKEIKDLDRKKKKIPHCHLNKKDVTLRTMTRTPDMFSVRYHLKVNV